MLGSAECHALRFPNSVLLWRELLVLINVNMHAWRQQAL